MSVATEEVAQLGANPSGKKGHRWQISCLEFSPDGTRLASGSWDKEVRIWDVGKLSTARLLANVHRVPVTSLSWYQNGMLCSGAADYTASLWSAADGSHLATLSGHEGWVLDVCFARYTFLLATASRDCTVRLWDPTILTTTSTLKHDGGVWTVAFQPAAGDAALLCTGCEDGSISLWDPRLAGGGPVRKFSEKGGHKECVFCTQWSARGDIIASGSEDTKVIVWDITSGKPLKTIHEHTAAVKSLSFGPSPPSAAASNAPVPILASAGDFQVVLSDPRPTHKASLLSLRQHEPGKEVEAVAVSSDGSLLASGSRSGKIVLTSLLNPAPGGSTSMEDQHTSTTNADDDPAAASAISGHDPQSRTTPTTTEQAPAIEQQNLSTPDESHARIMKKSSITKKSRRRRIKKKSIDVSMAEHLDPTQQNKDNLLLVPDTLHDDSHAEIDNEELTGIEKQLLLETQFSPLSIDSEMQNDSNQFSYIDSNLSVANNDDDNDGQRQYKKLKNSGEKLSISGITIGTVEALEIEHHDILEEVAEESAEEYEDETFGNENELALSEL